MKISKADRTLYFIIILNLAICIIANLLISILEMSFTWDTLISATFWINVAITQVLTLTPYFTCIALGKNEAEKCDEIIGIQKDVNKDFENIDELFLSVDLDEFINIQNLEYRCIGRIRDLNYLIGKCKDFDNKRKKLVEEKEKCVHWKTYYHKLNTVKDEIDKPNNNYDITEVDVKCDHINARTFKTNSKRHYSYEIGAFKEEEVIARDSIKKITLSLIMTCMFAVAGEGMLTGGLQGVYNVVWRTFLIILNSFMGYREGVKLIKVYKFESFKEKKEVLNNFFNKMFLKGKIRAKNE